MIHCGGDPAKLCWPFENYREGQQLTRKAQEHYAEFHGGRIYPCAHCYHVEDGESCCHCESTGFTDDVQWSTQFIPQKAVR